MQLTRIDVMHQVPKPGDVLCRCKLDRQLSKVNLTLYRYIGTLNQHPVTKVKHLVQVFITPIIPKKKNCPSREKSSPSQAPRLASASQQHTSSLRMRGASNLPSRHQPHDATEAARSSSDPDPPTRPAAPILCRTPGRRRPAPPASTPGSTRTVRTPASGRLDGCGGANIAGVVRPPQPAPPS